MARPRTWRATRRSASAPTWPGTTSSATWTNCCSANACATSRTCCPTARWCCAAFSVIAQYHATLQGQSLAILPCFIAAQDPRLTPVLPDDIAITRSFWMYCHEDLRRLKRVSALWEFMRRSVMRNAALLQGRGAALQYLP